MACSEIVSNAYHSKTKRQKINGLWLITSMFDFLDGLLPNSRSQYLLAISLVPSSSSHWALFQRSPFLDSSSSLKGPQLVGGFLDGSVGIKLNKREERIWPEASKGLMQEDLHCSTYSAQVLGFCYVNFFLFFFVEHVNTNVL